MHIKYAVLGIAIAFVVGVIANPAAGLAAALGAQIAVRRRRGRSADAEE